MSENVLVTGGAGFIGSHLVRYLLLTTTFEITILDDLSGGCRDNIPDDRRIKLVVGSITDTTIVEQLFSRHKFRYVYHLAAYAAEGLSHFIRVFNYTTNVVGSMSIINAAINYKSECLVFTSSIAVYGTAPSPISDDVVPHPVDPYGIAKYCVELDLAVARKTHGLNYVVFRPHNVYGEYQNVGDPYRNVIGIFMNQILQGRPMTIFGDGNQVRAFTYVGDIIGPIARSAWTPVAYGKSYNIGADTPYTVNQLARAVAKAMGSPHHPMVYLPERCEVKVAYADHSRVRADFGYTSSTPLDEGLRRMAEWVRRNGSRESRSFDQIEINVGLPEIWKNR